MRSPSRQKLEAWQDDESKSDDVEEVKPEARTKAAASVLEAQDFRTSGV